MLSNHSHQAMQGSVMFTYAATFRHECVMCHNSVGDAGKRFSRSRIASWYSIKKKALAWVRRCIPLVSQSFFSVHFFACAN